MVELGWFQLANIDNGSNWPEGKVEDSSLTRKVREKLAQAFGGNWEYKYLIDDLVGRVSGCISLPDGCHKIRVYIDVDLLDDDTAAQISERTKVVLNWCERVIAAGLPLCPECLEPNLTH